MQPIRAALVSILLAACSAGPFAGPDISPDAGLPSCASAGCPGPDLLCTRAGVCSCPQPDGGVIECERGVIDAGAP